MHSYTTPRLDTSFKNLESTEQAFKPEDQKNSNTWYFHIHEKARAFEESNPFPEYNDKASVHSNFSYYSARLSTREACLLFRSFVISRRT